MTTNEDGARGEPRRWAGKTADDEAARRAVFVLAAEIQRKAEELAAHAQALLEELEREPI